MCVVLDFCVIIIRLFFEGLNMSNFVFYPHKKNGMF